MKAAHPAWHLAPAGFAIAALVATWPLVLHLGTRLPGFEARTDTLFQVVFSRWFATALAAGTDPYRVWSVLFPVGSVDFFAKNGTCFNALLSVPLQPLVGLVAAVNLTALGLLAFNGWAAFRLGRHLGASAPAAFVGGVCLVLAPYCQVMFSSYSLDQLSLGWALTFLLYLLRTLDRPGLHNPFLAALAFLLTAVSFLGYAFLFALVGAIALLHFAVVRWERLDRALLLRLLVLGLAAAAAIAPIAIAFRAAGGASELDPAAATSFTLDLAPGPDVLGSPANRIVLANSLPWIGSAARIQVVTLVLAAVGILGGPRRASLWVALGLVFLVLAFGPYLKLGDSVEDGSVVPLPGLALYALGGIFARFRFPFRYVVVTWIAVAVAAGLGVRVLERRLAVTPARAALLAGGLVALLLGETAARPLGMLPTVTFPAPEVPRYFREVLPTEPDLAVLPIPLLLHKPSLEQEASFPEPLWHPLEMYYQAFHGHRLLAGPEFSVRLPPQLEAFAAGSTLVQALLVWQADPAAPPRPIAERDLEALSELGFGWVVVSTGWLRPDVRGGMVDLLEQLFGRPRLFQDDQIAVFDVRGRGALRTSADPDAWLHPRSALAEALLPPAERDALAMPPRATQLARAGELAIQAGDATRAERYWRYALDLDPDLEAAAAPLLGLLVRQRRWEAIVTLARARVGRRSGAAGAAVEARFAEQELALQRTFSAAGCLALAAAYAEAGEPRRALSCLERASAEDPADGSLRAALGRTYEELGWPSLALAAYSAALALDPGLAIDTGGARVPAAEHPLASGAR